MNQTPEKPEEDETPRPASIYLAKEKPPVQSVSEDDASETVLLTEQPAKPVLQSQDIDAANELFKQLSESSNDKPEVAEEPKE